MSLQELMAYPLSDSDIKKYMKRFNIHCKVVTYDKLYKYKSIDKVWGPDKCFILLYLTKPDYGHYVAVFKRDKKNIEVFDPYGDMHIDQQLEYVPIHMRNKLNENYPYLSNLLVKTGANIHFNTHPFQQYSDKISVCGRWGMMRILKRKLTIDQFFKWIKENCKKFKILPDEFVTLSTRDLKLTH